MLRTSTKRVREKSTFIRPESNSRSVRAVWERRAGVTWLAAGVLWFVLEAIAAAGFPGYSYANNFISDLGIPSPETLQGQRVGSPLALVMNVNFIAHGALFLLGSVFAFRAAGGGAARFVFLALVAANALGNVLIVAVHGSAQAAANGSITWHAYGAALAIYGADIAIVVAAATAGRLGASPAYRAASFALGILGLSSISFLVGAPGNAVPVGLWERLGVYPIMVWESMTGLAILVYNRRAVG